MIDQRSISGAISTVANASDNERKVLALEALSKLAAQFGRDPDLQKLLDSLALTISGQFGVTSTYIAARTFNSDILPPITSATGKFRTVSDGSGLFNLMLSLSNLEIDPGPFLLTEQPSPFGEDSIAMIEMRRLDVRLFAPMIVDNKVIGLILLGPRIRNVDFGEPDVELLRALVISITPLIANSLLYAEMAQLKNRYHSIIDSVPQAMFVFDSQKVLRTANKTAIDLIKSYGGVTRDGSPIGLPLNIIFPDGDFSDWSERLRAVGDDGDEKLHPTVMVKKNNIEKIFSVRTSTFVSQPGSESERIVTLQDITDQKENEQRMFELEKFAEQGMMASSISHELNNFLGMILGGAELAMVSLERGKSDKVAATLNKIKDSIAAMQRFTSGLMDFARVNVVIQPGNINDVMNDVLSFVMSQKRFAQIKVKSQLEHKLPVIEMDRDQIAQVMINILNNAADAIAETGRSDGIIMVTTAIEDNFIILSISDNGKGMKPEVRDRLFKAHLTTKPKGHGYGLINCGKIIERHGATVTITSQLGFGTTFDIRFPLAATPNSQTSPPTDK
jgi:two-component system NtrC family sensor kinase